MNMHLKIILILKDIEDSDVRKNMNNKEMKTREKNSTWS